MRKVYPIKIGTSYLTCLRKKNAKTTLNKSNQYIIIQFITNTTTDQTRQIIKFGYYTQIIQSYPK
jgi:hypothetical protein